MRGSIRWTIALLALIYGCMYLAAGQLEGDYGKALQERSEKLEIQLSEAIQ